MKVKEMLEELQAVDPELNVFFEDEEGKPIPLTTLQIQRLYQAYQDEEGKKRYQFFDGVVLCNE